MNGMTIKGNGSVALGMSFGNLINADYWKNGSQASIADMLPPVFLISYWWIMVFVTNQ
jgi:hypothetical protein